MNYMLRISSWLADWSKIKVGLSGLSPLKDKSMKVLTKASAARQQRNRVVTRRLKPLVPCALKVYNVLGSGGFLFANRKWQIANRVDGWNYLPVAIGYLHRRVINNGKNCKKNN